MSFTFKRLEIPEVILVDAQEFPDERGYFLESFKESIFTNNGINTKFIQDNFSHSVKGVLRGLHYQKNPKAQGKLVIALRGEIFDVAVDIRKNSPTFLQWHSEILTADKGNSLFISEGFAHGFQTLTNNCELLYMHSNFYSQEAEGALNAFDPKINISWPLEVTEISDRDRNIPLIDK